MEETLTLARVIENINYVYGEKLVKALFLFVLLEIVALVFITKKKPEWIKYLKLIVLGIATVTSLVMLSRSKVQEGFSKLELNNTTCAFKEIYDNHGPDHMTWADEIIYEQHYSMAYGVKSDSNKEYNLAVICEESISRNVLQTIACVVPMLIGFFIARCVIKKEHIILRAALSVPIGASVLVAITLFLIVFHIPYCWSTVLLLIALVLGAIIWCSYKNKLPIEKQEIVVLGVFILLAVLATQLKFYRLAGDARWQMLYARDLVTHHYLMEEFFQVATYGFLGTSLHAFGILLGGDMLYSYFLLIGLSAIAIIVSTTYVLSKDQSEKIVVYAFMLIGIVFLVTNFDYLYYTEWILSNGAVGVCILSIVALSYLHIEKGTDVTLMIALLSFAVITTRIEGVCYVVLLLSVPFKRVGELKKTNIIVGCEIIIWQIVQFVLSTGVGQDGWTKSTGVALSLVGIILMIEPYLINFKIIEKIMLHYKIVYGVLFVFILFLGFVHDETMTLDNFVVFLSHFTVSKNSNSFALWGFILVLLPIAIRGALQEKDSILLVPIFYILLVLGISLFRTGNPLHTGTSDSFRRVLCQVMPLTVWLVTYYAGKSKV